MRSEPTTRVLLVRPWTDASAGGGCCGGSVHDGVCLEPGRVGSGRAGSGRAGADRAGADRVDARRMGSGGGAATEQGERLAATWLRLRDELPDVDVQVVGAGNTAYLLPTVFGTVRRRRGVRAALRAAAQATTAGAVLVDGERIGLLADLEPDEVVEQVRRQLV